MLTARTSARYALRVFGYLLATTLAAGVVVGLGAGAAYALESAFFTELPPGGPAVDLTALAAFGVGSALGLLVFAAGLIVTLADAVSVGVHAAETGTADAETAGETEATEAETAAEERTDATAETGEPTSDETAAEAPESGETVSESDETASVDGAEQEQTGDGDALGEPATEQSPSVTPSEGDEEPMDTDPFAEAAESDAYDPTDPIDDPHEAQSNPFGEPEEQPTADEWTSKTPQGEAGGEDDAAWREEIEAKLDDEE